MAKMAPIDKLTRTWGNSTSRGKHSVSATIPTEAADPLGVHPGDHVVWHIEYEPVRVTVRRASASEVEARQREIEENRRARAKMKKRSKVPSPS